MDAPDLANENAKLAYAEVSRGHQAITDFRAKLLALLPLASGAGILVLLGDEKSEPSSAHLVAIGLFGFVVTFGLFMYELRGVQQCHRLRDQGAIIEDALGFAKHTAPFRDRSTSRLRGVVGAEGASWIIYTAVMATWLYVAGSGAAIWENGRGLALAGIYILVLAIAWSRAPVTAADRDDDDSVPASQRR